MPLSGVQPAAVAVVRVSGPDAADAILRFWTPANGVAALELNRIRYGRWATRVSNKSGEAPAPAATSGEEVVVCRVGGDCFELHCHGGRAAQARILDDLLSAGVDQQPWVPAVGDPSSVAAGEDLLRAKTAKAAAVLHRQFTGRLTAELRRLVAASPNMTADARRGAAERLIAAGRVGVRLVDPFRVLLAGPPNAGKSTLLNRLLGWERAIVDAAPGTTRDALREEMSLGGWPLAVIDSAGLRRTSDAVESVGVSRAMELASQCDCLCLLVDPAEGWTEWHDALRSLGRPQLTIATKSDLYAAPRPPADWLRVSGATGEGIDAFVTQLLAELGLDDRLLDEPVPFRRRQLDRLSHALAQADSAEAFARELTELLATPCGSENR